MTLEELNEIINQFKLNMFVEGENIYFIDLNTNERMVTVYDELDENDFIKQIRTDKAYYLLNGDNFRVFSEDYKYNLNINLKDGKYYLTLVDKKPLEGFKQEEELNINQDPNNLKSFSFTYSFKAYNLGYEHKKIIVNSNNRMATIDYYEEDLKNGNISYYALVLNDDDQVIVSNRDNIYTTIITFEELIKRNPTFKKILEVIAPDIYTKCLSIDEKKMIKKI